MNNNRNNNQPQRNDRNVIQELKILVCEYDGDNLVKEEYLDYSVPRDRAWLGRWSVNAWEKGHTIETSKV